MNRKVALAFLAMSVVALLVFGYDAYNSISSHISLATTGAPTDESLWLVISGLLAGITGVFGLTSDTRNSP